jgi:hypothetical protein
VNHSIAIEPNTGSVTYAVFLIMDPDRVRAYLQVACAGLGFDIGEIWWSSNEAGSTALAAIGKSLCRVWDRNCPPSWKIIDVMLVM